MGSSQAQISLKELQDAIDMLEARYMALVGSVHNPVRPTYFPWGGLSAAKKVITRPTQPWQEWMKDKENSVTVVNGKVHAICHSSVIVQRPEHYERCPDCKVYGDTEVWQEEGALIAFADRDYERVECGVTCRRCVA